MNSPGRDLQWPCCNAAKQVAIGCVHHSSKSEGAVDKELVAAAKYSHHVNGGKKVTTAGVLFS